MNDLQKLLAQLEEIDGKIDATDQAIDGLLANDELTEEQQAEHDRFVAERATLLKSREKCQASIEREKDRQNRTNERTQLAGLLTTGRRTQPDQQTSSSTGVPVNVRVHGSLANFHGTQDGRTAAERAYRFGMHALARLSADMPNRYSFPHAVDFCRQHGIQGALHQSNDGNGTSFLIPTEFSPDVIVLRERYGVARRVFRNVPMLSDTRKEPRRIGGLTAYFRSEGAAGTTSKMTHDQVELVARDLMVLTTMSSQVGEDAAVNFGDTLLGEIVQALSQKEDASAFNGDGTGTYGGILGVRAALAQGTKAGLKVQGTSNTWSALVLADFDKVVGALPQYADTPNTCWLMHRTFFYEVVDKLVQAAGGTTASEVREGERRPRPLFKGYPVEFCQSFPSTTAAATVACTLGDYSQGAMFGDRSQPSFAFSDSAVVGGASVFERDEIAVRGTERFDINVFGAGDDTTPGPIVGLRTGN